MKTLHGPATRLTVFLGDSDQWHHKPLYTEIVHRAQQAGMAGATVLRGVEGFGPSNHLHTTRILSLSEDLPVAIVIVDTTDKCARSSRGARWWSTSSVRSFSASSRGDRAAGGYGPCWQPGFCGAFTTYWALFWA